MAAIELPALGPDALRQFRADGHAVVRGLLDAASIEALRTECERLLGLGDLIHGDNLRCRWADHVQTGECRFDCFDPVIDLSPVIAGVARAPQLLVLLETLLGEPAQLFKDKLIYKPRGAPGYPLHQDYIAWDGFPRSFTTVIVAIDPSTTANGATEVFTGYHAQGSLAPEDGEFHRLDPAVVDADRGVVLELAPGDVACFGGFVPHRSAPNLGADWRRLLYLSYNAQSDGGDQRSTHYREFHAWLAAKYAEHGRTRTWFR